MYIKILNFVQADGKCDYKGLDTKKIEIGSQIDYSKGDNTFYFIYNGEISQNVDLIQITENEYLTKKQETPKTEMELLQEKVALQEQSILELSMMLTGGAV